MNPFRWRPRRKAEIVELVRVGHLSAPAACGLYGLTPEELAAWQRDYTAYGVAGLAVTKTQIYRKDKAMK